jgi:hypothetical protein
LLVLAVASVIALAANENESTAAQFAQGFVIVALVYEAIWSVS